MDAIATTIRNAGLVQDAYPYQPRSYTPPCAIVNYPRPNEIELNQTFQHGKYKATFTVDFVVGSVNGLEARDALSAILDGAGSLAQSLESSTSALGAVVDTVAVTDVGIVFLPGNDGSELLGARFTVEVGGR